MLVADALYFSLHVQLSFVTKQLFRFQSRAIAEIINSGIQAVQNLAVLQKVAEITGKDVEKMKWGHYWIHRGFQGTYQKSGKIMYDTSNSMSQ